MFSENSYGVCVPVNSSANEIIVGMARASALQNSGSNGKAEASYPHESSTASSCRLPESLRGSAYPVRTQHSSPSSVEGGHGVLAGMRALP